LAKAIGFHPIEGGPSNAYGADKEVFRPNGVDGIALIETNHFMPKIETPAKENTLLVDAPDQEPGEDSVRAYAFHLYQEGGCSPGHDLDNWLEATACLKAHIPEHASQSRLSQHVNELARTGPLLISQAMAKRELAVLRQGREDLESEPMAADGNVRASLFDDRP